MSKMKFLDLEEAEKFKEQKWVMFCGTPCRISVLVLFLYNLLIFECYFHNIYAIYAHTGCPTKHFPLLFFEFLGFLEV